jgi:hypothetical protein
MVENVVLVAARRALLNDFLGLLLRSHEEHVAPASGDFADQLAGLLQHGERLLEIQDVDLVLLHEDVLLHLRVPALGLVPEVNARFQERSQCHVGQNRTPLGFASVIFIPFGTAALRWCAGGPPVRSDDV